MGDDPLSGSLRIDRWSIEQIEAIAPSPAAISAARPIATPGRWQRTGADSESLWGSFSGGSAEPYDTMVDHVSVGFSCSCPSRRVPCKHALALLLLWVGGHVPLDVAPPAVATWAARHRPIQPDPGISIASGTSDAPAATEIPHGTEIPGSTGTGHEGSGLEPESRGDAGTDARDDRVARMREGLGELDRWLLDRMRAGLADPALAEYDTWDRLAARLVDARAGSLANRVRRLAGLVGASPDWHERVLEEIGLLHLLATAGRRLGELPEPLGDLVATTVGWQVRHADVLAGVPETDQWIVAGRSDTREDRIEVRRHWLRGATTNRWALVLSFAAYRQSLDTSLTVGTSVHADVHRYPGEALRALVGQHYAAPVGPARPHPSTIAAAVDEIGRHIAREPWLDRVPAVIRAAVTTSEGRWMLTDETGSLPLANTVGVDTMLAVSAGDLIDLTIEWMPAGVTLLAIHRTGGSLDVGPSADPSFVSAA